MSQNLKVVTYNVYGTKSKGKYLKIRLPYIVKEIIKNGNPDIICLQEATNPIINALKKKLPKYYVWKKTDSMNKKILSKEDKQLLNQDGFMVIMSKWKFIEKQLVLSSFLDDGIMKAKINSEKELGINLTIFNYHGSGGTFGKSKAVIEGKRESRIKELQILNREIINHMYDNILIVGDFNADANDKLHYPELNYSPENVIKQTFDVWKKLMKKSIGATENEVINTFRSCMKIKPIHQKRQVRYDRILYKGNNIKPVNISLIGNHKINKKVLIEGKDINKKKSINKCYLFPSDHFGLFSQFIIRRSFRK